MISRISSVAFDGIWAKEVDVQVAIAKGLPNFNIVGLADKSVSESKERLRSAFYHLGFSLPAERITVNLSPSNLAKEGNHFDLPIALALLGAMDIIPRDMLYNIIAIGEITLDGEIKPSNGVLAACVFALEHNKNIIIPQAQQHEAYIVHDKINVIPANNLLSLVNHFKGIKNISYIAPNKADLTKAAKPFVDIASIKGHKIAKEALAVAAAGGHNMLMIGPPGSGKSMLANALGGILPPLSTEEMLETSLIYSVIGELKDAPFITNRPYRSVHHSASLPALVGGGSKAKPGEITLAHNGVLFLDEFAEFSNSSIDALRQPIESGEILISRVNSHVTYPARFQLITAMNPCRCGYFGDKERECSKAPKCTETYQNRISGPILDRIDIAIEVTPVSIFELNNANESIETSAELQKRIIRAREIQQIRYKNYNISTNANASSEIIEKTVHLHTEARNLLNMSAEKFKISTRGYFRVIKTALSIADLAGNDTIEISHISQALAYRKINYYQQSQAKPYLE